jgi:hypothetical protein|tara:strand:+ start:3294 stop:3539 length:246 start_codon:yes stop_codon:yes gene_type:complete
MDEEVMSNGNKNEQLHIPVVVRSVTEIEERLRMVIVGMEHARECGNEEVRKDYEKDVSCLFWVLGRSGSYDYIDNEVILYD